MEISLGIDLRKVMPLTNREGRKRLADAMRWAVGESSRDLLTRVRARVQGSSMIGLAQSWRDLPTEETEPYVYSGGVGSDHPGALLRDKGNPRILPGKTAARSGPNRGQLTRALTIPLADAKTALGVTRQGRTASRSAVTAFGPMAAVLFGSRARGKVFGKLVEGVVSARTGKIVPAKPPRKEFFLLAEWISVRANPYMLPALQEGTAQRTKILLEAMRRATDVSPA